MKKRFLGLVLSMFLITSFGFSQGNKKQLQEKIEARKVAFLTNRLELTPDEAQQFWPVYNEYQAKRKAIKKEYRGKSNLSLLTDEEVSDYIDKQLKNEEQSFLLKKEYIIKLKKVLPIRKVAMLPRLENRFKEWMLSQIKQRNGRN